MHESVCHACIRLMRAITRNMFKSGASCKGKWGFIYRATHSWMWLSDFYRSNLRRKKNSTNFSKPLWYCEQEPISWSRVIKWKAIWMSGWDFTMSQPRCGNQPWLLFVLLRSLLELRGGGGHELLRFIIRVNLFFLKKKKKGRSRKPQGVMHHYQLSQFRQIPLSH